jgi:ribosomal 50S subunit-associated protein YjgA (DUF615 family)
MEMMEELITWLKGERRRVKERAMRRGDRLYWIRDLLPDSLTMKQLRNKNEKLYKEAEAIREIYMTEGSSLYAPFIEWHANALYDPIASSDFPERDIRKLRGLLRDIEIEYEQREKLIITRSQKHIYVKRSEGKIMLSGDTFPIKEELKKMGFRWDPSFRTWYKREKEVDFEKLKRELEAL